MGQAEAAQAPCRNRSFVWGILAAWSGRFGESGSLIGALILRPNYYCLLSAFFRSPLLTIFLMNIAKRNSGEIHRQPIQNSPADPCLSPFCRDLNESRHIHYYLRHRRNRCHLHVSFEPIKQNPMRSKSSEREFLLPATSLAAYKTFYICASHRRKYLQDTYQGSFEAHISSSVLLGRCPLRRRQKTHIGC